MYVYDPIKRRWNEDNTNSGDIYRYCGLMEKPGIWCGVDESVISVSPPTDDFYIGQTAMTAHLISLLFAAPNRNFVLCLDQFGDVIGFFRHPTSDTPTIVTAKKDEFI